MNEPIKIKRGNSANIEIACYDRAGDILTNLAATSEVHFQVKRREAQAVPDIAKIKGAGVAVNTPDTGWVTVSLDPTDTAIEVALYYMALQLEFAGGEAYECRIFVNKKETERLRITQDIIQ